MPGMALNRRAARRRANEGTSFMFVVTDVMMIKICDEFCFVFGLLLMYYALP